MNVFYDVERGAFRLDTPRSSYIMALADGKWLGHVYYGPRLTDGPLDWTMGCLGLDEKPYTPDRYPKDEASFFDRFPAEYPVSNVGDFRECCLGIQVTQGTADCLLEFRACEILPGKPALEGLPATFGGADACNTLKICLEDQAVGFYVELYYTAFTNLDVITRSVRVVNHGAEAAYLDRCLSACLHLPYDGQQMVTLHGSWARERGIQVQEIARGFQGTSSHRGISSHQEHPSLDDRTTVKIVDRNKDFADVSGHWSTDAIAFVSSRDIFSGTGANTFSPDATMTRAMLATVLARFDGVDTTGGTPGDEKGIEWAMNAGVSDGSDPEREITREQMVVMLYRYAGSPVASGSLSGFTDADKVSSYALTATQWAVEQGIITGKPDNMLDPQGSATRAEVAAILMRFCSKMV